MNRIEKLLPYILLLKAGEFQGARTTERDVDRCINLRWAVRSGRKNHCVITDLGKSQIVEFLTNQYPHWETLYDDLLAAGFEATIDGIRGFQHREKTAKIKLPPKIHHKTLACCGGKHSKVGLSQRLKKTAENIVVTTDQVLRISANRGLVLQHSPEDCVASDQIMAVLGEVVIPERAFLDGIVVAGTLPKAVVTIENRGAYVDFPRISSEIMLVHVPGDDTALAIRLLNLLPSTTPCYHFGDLDPKGLKIAEYLKQNIPQSLRLFTPAFWSDYVAEAPVSPKKWPKGYVVEFEFDLLETLKSEQRWLEQERILLDPRLASEIDRILGLASSSQRA